MAVPYTKADPFNPDHICLVCRKVIRSLEIVDDLGPDRFVHVACGGITPETAALANGRVGELEIVIKEQENKIQALRSQLRLSQKHTKQLAAKLQTANARFSEVTPRITKNGDQVRELSLQLRAQKRANELLQRRAKA
jgi:uncharacterized coiled-coil protein SlyX